MLRSPEGTRRVGALVDSGADRTILSRETARLLGLEGHLVEDDAPGRAVDGTEFTTWSSSVPVTGEIFLQARGGRTTWGRPFPLRPAFAEGVEAALLGRSDFFNAFSVHFTTRRSTAVMYIDTGLRARVSGIPWSLVPEPAIRALLRRRRR